MEPAAERPGVAGLRLHRNYYFTSVLRTIAFYGTVVAACLLFPVLVSLGISLFFLKFYRREIRSFLRHPVRTLIRDKPEEFDCYSFEVFPPGSHGSPGPGPRPRQDGSSKNGRQS